MHAFLMDEALASRLVIADLRQHDQPVKRGPLPPGFRWATDAEQGVDDLAAALADSQAALEVAHGR